MSVSHVYFYSFQIIFTFQCPLPTVLTIITQDSERLLFFKNTAIGYPIAVSCQFTVFQKNYIEDHVDICIPLDTTFAKFWTCVVYASVVPHEQPIPQTDMQLQAKDITVPLLTEFFFPNVFFIVISSFHEYFINKIIM